MIRTASLSALTALVACGGAEVAEPKAPTHHAATPLSVPDASTEADAGASVADTISTDLAAQDDTAWNAAATSCQRPSHFYDCDTLRSYVQTFPQGRHAAEATALLTSVQAKLDGLHDAWKANMARLSADAARTLGTLTTRIPPNLRDMMRTMVWNCAHGSAVNCLQIKLETSMPGPLPKDPRAVDKLVDDALKRACADLTTKGCKLKVANDYANHQGKRKCTPGEVCGSPCSCWYDGQEEATTDERKALDLYEQACAEGDVDACTNLGTAYADDSTNDGVPVDPVKSVEFYRKACDLGFPVACRALAFAYRDGRPPAVLADPTRAMELDEWACETGDGASCNDLGVLYDAGRGVAQDRQKAYDVFRRACDLARARPGAAQGNLGCTNAEHYFDAGIGLPPQEAKKRSDQIATNRKMEAAHPESGALFPRRDASGEVADKGCRLLGFDLVQKLPEPHMYEGAVGAVGCGNLGCLAPTANFLLRTKVHEFSRPGQKMICVRPEETWTTVTTVRGFTEARVVLEESLCNCPGVP
jgi:TPR repeat protein